MIAASASPCVVPARGRELAVRLAACLTAMSRSCGGSMTPTVSCAAPTSACGRGSHQTGSASSTTEPRRLAGARSPSWQTRARPGA